MIQCDKTRFRIKNEVGEHFVQCVVTDAARSMVCGT